MVIDFHTHILPSVDDGSRSVEESVKMLEMQAQQGIKRVIATPHFYAHHDSPERFLQKRKDAEIRLLQAIDGRSDLPEIKCGAEVYYFSGISESNVLDELTIDSKKCILLELPSAPWHEKIYSELENIWIKHGITPVIAHIDRYIGPFKNRGLIERIADLPVKIQANASFFISRGTRRMALKLLRENKIHLLGSDCHNMTSRVPNLDAAVEIIESKLGLAAVEQIELNEQDILDIF